MDIGRRLAGRPLVTALTGVVALLSLVTGVANLASTGQPLPVAAYVPETVRTFVSLTGAFTGFAMLVSAWGLRRGLRSAWYSTVVLLPVTAIQGVVQSNELSLPLVVLSLLALPVVVLSRRRFTREVTFTQAQLTALVALGGVLLYGTVGTYGLRDQFVGVDTPLDAFYYTIVTASTVGYGDLAPKSALGRAFSLSLIVVGTAAFALAAGALLAPAFEARLTKALGRMTQSELELLEDHVLVLGYGELTEPILTELVGKADFVVVTSAPDQAEELRGRGYSVVTGDPSDEETLERVHLERARAVVVATDDDAEDALAVLTAYHLNPEVHVVAAASQLENVDKLKRAGADTVISPASIVGRLLVESALSTAVWEDVQELTDRILDETGAGS